MKAVSAVAAGRGVAVGGTLVRWGVKMFQEPPCHTRACLGILSRRDNHPNQLLMTILYRLRQSIRSHHITSCDAHGTIIRL